MHVIGPLHLIFHVLTGCHLYSGHVPRCVSPWSNSCRQLLELWLRPRSRVYTTCVCQSCCTHAAARPGAARRPLRVTTPLLISAFPSCPADPVCRRWQGEELAYLPYSPQGSSHTQTSAPTITHTHTRSCEGRCVLTNDNAAFNYRCPSFDLSPVTLSRKLFI